MMHNKIEGHLINIVNIQHSMQYSILHDQGLGDRVKLDFSQIDQHNHPLLH